MILTARQHQMGQREPGLPQQSGKKFRRIIRERHRHSPGRALLRYLHAHALDHRRIVVQGAGSAGRTADSEAGLDMVAHGKTKTAADIFSIEPYRLLEQGQFAYALCCHPGWRRQHKTWPVMDLESRAGQKDVLRAAADVNAKDRACFLQK